MISLTEQGKKHQPLTKIEDKELIIQVWREIEHPMEEVHLIEDIDILQITKAWLIRVKNFHLKAWEKPLVKIPLSELKEWTYKIQTRCNLHWTWEDEITI